MHEGRGLIVVSDAPWLKHCCAHVTCYTARGEPRCACGMYKLSWEGDTDANSP